MPVCSMTDRGGHTVSRGAARLAARGAAIPHSIPPYSFAAFREGLSGQSKGAIFAACYESPFEVSNGAVSSADDNAVT